MGRILYCKGDRPARRVGQPGQSLPVCRQATHHGKPHAAVSAQLRDVPKGPSDKAIPLLENGGTTGIAPVYYFPADHKAQGRKLGETDDTHSSLFWRSSAGWAGVCPERYWRTRDGSGRTGCPGRFSPALDRSEEHTSELQPLMR